MSKLYTILLSSDLKTRNVHHRHPNKKKVSAFKSEILIKYNNSIGPLAVRLRSYSLGENNLFTLLGKSELAKPI